MKDFLHRAYRIITDEALDNDYKLTNIHACLAHVLLVSKINHSLFICKFFFQRMHEKPSTNLLINNIVNLQCGLLLY
jgi:hypothetical protein